jgi:hypothetical protein
MDWGRQHCYSACAKSSDVRCHASPNHETGTGTTRLHASLSHGEDFNVPQRAGRRTQAGHGTVCRSQRLHGTPGGPRPGGGTPAPQSGAGAHEDHAIRACYAALAIQDAIRRYSDEVRRAHGIEVQIRVGINSGEVVVRAIGNDLHMDYSAIGQTTHLAARMEQLAPPGSIRLTADTLRLAEGWVQVTPLGPVPVKGLPAPVEVCELVGAGPARTRLQAYAARGLTPFVGRQAELAALHQALEQAGAGHGQVVAVIGDPGVGKTRLFHEFTHASHTQGWLLLESSSTSYGKATPYLPVIDLLKAYFQLEDRDDGRHMREKLTGRLLTLAPTLGPTLPAFLALLEVPVEDPAWQALDPAQRRQRTLDALKRLLLRESQVQPLLLVFENLHWIDAETQVFLNSLVESLHTARVLLLVNYRPEYQHGWSQKTYYTQLRLDPLPPASAEALLHSLLGDDASLEPLQQRLIERTQGNPFFLEESVRTLVETQILVGDQGAYRLARTLPTIQVPSTVQAVLAARIDRLPPEEKQLLQTAAVIGTEVPLALLQAMAEVPEASLRLGLTHLQAAEFLYETRSSPSTSTLSSTLSPSRWPTRRYSKSGGVGCMPALSRLWRRLLESEWPRWLLGEARTKSSAWRTMPCGARCGTRLWSTSGRQGRRPWRGQPTERPWGTSSRRLALSCICQSSAIHLSRLSTSGLPYARRSGRLATWGVSWRICARPRPSRKPSRLPQPVGRLSCKRRRTSVSAKPTRPRVTIVEPSTASGRAWQDSTGCSAASTLVRSSCPPCSPVPTSPGAMPSWARSPRAGPLGTKGSGLLRKLLTLGASCMPITGSVCWPSARATCPGPSLCSSGL